MRARPPLAPVPARQGTTAGRSHQKECAGSARARYARSAVPSPYAKAQLSRRRRSLYGEASAMARRRKKRTLKPRLPARVRTKRRKGKQKSEQRHELIGLGLVALGIFLASILYLSWGGGMVGEWIAYGFTGTIGAAAYVAPVALTTVGALMVARSALIDVRPFRTGLAVTSFGLLLALGSGHGGAIGARLATMFGLLLVNTGTTIVGVFALVIGPLPLSRPSAAPAVRGCAHAVKRAHARAGDQGLEGGGAQGRLVVCPRDDGDSHPRAHPGKTGGRRRAAEPAAESRHARRHLRRSAVDGFAARGLARQRHFRHRGLDRSR